jgi:hypothetical protein
MNKGQTWRSESSLTLEISDRRLQIPYFWNLRFAICNPEGHVLAAQGLPLPRSTAQSAFKRIGTRLDLTPQ